MSPINPSQQAALLETQASYRCPDCKGLNVQGTAWVDLNKNAMTNDESPTDDYWCPDCDEHISHVEMFYDGKWND